MSIILGLAVGLGIFLYGMHQLELGAKELSGGSLKGWLISATRTRFSSIGSGVFITTLLQSSSLVGLIVLAFASAGIVPLQSAIGIFLGTNLGSTITGWIVVLLGFKMDLVGLALPLVALGGISQVVLPNTSRWRSGGVLILGVGLLLFGLATMKDSVANLPTLIPQAYFSGHSPFIYLLAGIILTAIIQSSSAMMMIALAALDAQLISFPAAAAVVIGANLGTTSTIVLGSIAGNVIKRQLAFSHFVFNLVVVVIGFAILLPWLPDVMDALGIQDPLYALVASHSIFNLLGLCLFFPILTPFTLWVARLFKAPDARASVLQSVSLQVPTAAIAAVQQAVKTLWIEATELNLSLFGIDIRNLKLAEGELLTSSTLEKSRLPFRDGYEALKSEEGAILSFLLRLQQQELAAEQTHQVSGALNAMRSIIYSCKTLKDIRDNLQDLHTEPSANSHQQWESHKNYHVGFYEKVLHLVLTPHIASFRHEELEKMNADNDAHQAQMDKLIYQQALSGGLQAISSHLNVNREVHHSAKNILRGIEEWAQLCNGSST